MVSFLLSAESSYLTAQVLHVDGGLCGMFEVVPDRTASEIRQILRDTAVGDAKTGTLPNPAWASASSTCSRPCAASLRSSSTASNPAIPADGPWRSPEPVAHFEQGGDLAHGAQVRWIGGPWLVLFIPLVSA